MYVEGIVSEIDKKNYKVKLTIEEFDNFKTPWLSILQRYVVKNKSGFLPEKNTLAAAVLSDDMTYGAYLGAIYNGIDKPLEEKEDSDYIKFEDGTLIEHKNNSKALNLEVENLYVKGNIVSTGDISDKKGTIQAIRDWGDSHEHPNGNNGAKTGAPVDKI